MEKKMQAGREVGRGLCESCVHDPTCTYPRKPGIRVRNCLEFQGELLDESLRSVAAVRPAGANPGSPQREPGLCAWCDRQSTCTYPKASGGVWFCEEYL
jgi:hypothetical protein